MSMPQSSVLSQDLRPRTLLGLIGENGVSALAASVVQNRSVSEPGVGTAFPQ